MRVDEDAPKKSLTDAIVKAASQVGIAANIFLGRWDDQKYVAQVNAEYREEERQQAKPQFDAAHDRAVIDAQVMIESAETQADLRTVWGKLARTVQADARVIEAKDKRKTELEGQ